LSSLLTKVGTSNLLTSFSGGGSAIAMPYFYTFNLQQMAAYLSNPAQFSKLAIGGTIPWGVFGPNGFAADNYVDEESNSAYMVADLDKDIGSMHLRVRPGVRYEQTQVTGDAKAQIPNAIYWTSPTEFHTIYQGGNTYNTQGSNYHEFLPALDSSLSITDDLIARASYSWTMTRPSLSSMAPAVSVASTPAPGQQTGTNGNPALKPFLSHNIDVSGEWYFNKDSYLSAGYFLKNVSNFIVNTTVNESEFGLTNILAGPRYAKAVQELQAKGLQTTQDQVFRQMVADQGGTTPLVANSTDPLLIWQMTIPENQRRISLHGFEFAAQYALADTGFGALASVSLPTGGAHFDNLSIGNQFAVPGLSRSYSLTGYYEKYGFQFRAVYNWRDSFYAGTVGGDGTDPLYVAARGQVDLNAAYEIHDGINVFASAINVTGEGVRQYSRTTDMTVAFYQNAPFVQAGVRLKF
jgi:TonB-dependent receptor